jgi:prepilin-type N-terminal cleavage/methylation domain-containing protein
MKLNICSHRASARCGVKKTASFGDVRGMTLIEVLIAMALLSVVLIGMAIMISLGFLQMNNMRVQRAASNCARIVMEYLETIPPDVIYGWNKQMPLNGDFASGAGVTSLNTFINSGDDACQKLSDTTGDPLGKKVKLTYSICPGCYSTTQLDPIDPVNGKPWTTCFYFVKVRISYNGLNLGGNRKIEYDKKYYSGAVGDCTDTPNGCGTGDLPPGTLRDCRLP